MLLPATARPVELPSTGQIRHGIGLPPQTVTVLEPHLSVADRHVAVAYVGYRAVDVFAHVLSEDWRDRAETIEFRALDGYVARIDAARFLKDGAFLVSAKENGTPFTVDNFRQNEKGVPLRPWYLVWDNIANPALKAEGAGNWPYRVKEIGLVHAVERGVAAGGPGHPIPRGGRTGEDPFAWTATR